jgi:hypothetical protein
VNDYFDLVNRVKWNDADPLSAANLTAFDKWLPGKTLILNGDSTIATGVSGATNTDISAKGALVVAGSLDPEGVVTSVTATVDGGQTLTTNGIPVLITENAILELESDSTDGDSYLVGSFKVNGTLSAKLTGNTGIFKTSIIPAGVDLSNATLLGDTVGSSNTAVFQFPPSNSPDSAVVTIKTIDVTHNLGIANTKGLIVDLITNPSSAAKTLTLPNNVDTKVKRIDTIGEDLTIKGEDTNAASYAILKPDLVYGANTLTLGGTNILVDGNFKVESNTTIEAATLGPFGITSTNQLAQLAKINGGTVDVGTTALIIDRPTVLDTIIATTGDVTFAAETTLNRGMAVATTGTYIIKSGAKFTVGQYGQISMPTTPVLTIGPGVYAAAGGDFVIDSDDGVISSATTGATLTIGDAAEPAKLTLKANGTTNGTFTPTTAATTLNGAIGGLVVSDTGDLALGANAEIIIGTGGTIGFEETASITLAIGASISGFSSETATITTPANGDNFKAAAADVGKPWEGFTAGLTITGTLPTYTNHAIKATAANTIAGASPGGILTQASY